jgi:putative ABC transport system permease protein
LQSLDSTLSAYYQRYQFGDCFVRLKRAPRHLASRIAALEGVARVEARIVQEVILDVRGMAEPAVGRLVSIPEQGAPVLNRLHLRRGRYPEPGRSGEVLASEAFVKAHGFRIGDGVSAVLNGRRQELTIVGVALSPEYIYQFPPGGLLPDDRRFGVFWMGEKGLEAAFDMKEAVNEACVGLSRGASQPEILRQLDRLTAPYGGLGAHGRTEQSSHQFITNEMRELRGMALVVPVIFLLVAAFLVNVVLSRLISIQRGEIATLKAFGYMRSEVGWHYLKMALAMVTLGAVAGTLAGARLGAELTALYTRFFRFPLFAYKLSAGVLLLAGGASGLTALSGALWAVRRAVRLAPAAAMRPEPPARYRPTLLERAGLGALVPPAGRMVLRNLERRPLKALLSCLGIALATAVLILGNFSMDALDYAMESQFFVTQREDMNLTFVEPAARQALHDLSRLPGVWACEPFRTVPVHLRRGHRSRRVAILGLQPGGRLRRLTDLKREGAVLPPDGLVLSAKLAELLGASVSDKLTVEVQEGRRQALEVPVTGLFDDFSGTAAYMDIGAACRLVAGGETLSGAFLAVDPARAGALYGALKTSPRVASVTIKSAALQSFRETVAENLLRMRAFTAIFAGIIAAGVVYNAARISLSERSRELAILRVIGFTRGEISMMLLGELFLLTAAAVPLGLVLGKGLAALVVHLAYDTELFRIPLIIDRSTYAGAALFTVLAAVASGLLVRRRLDRLDLVAVLRTEEAA